MSRRRTLSSLIATAGLAVSLLVVAPAHAQPAGVPVALDRSGTITGWGDNTRGQTSVPALPAHLTYTAVAAGGSHSLALRSDGTVVGWGYNFYGQTDIPVLPAGLTYTAVAAGEYHSLAMRSDGTVVARGQNVYGQTNVPALPAGLTYTAIAAGGIHSLALRSDGTVVGWGSNFNAQTDVPALPAGLTYTAVDAGTFSSAALLSDGTAIAWGANSSGQTNVPALPAGLTYTEIALGAVHGLALRSDGTVVGWGDDGYGQITVPGLPAGMTYTAIAASGFHSLALRSDGTVVAFGLNTSGQTNTPAGLAGETVTAIAAGDYHSLALTRSSFSADHDPLIGGLPRIGEALTAVPGPYGLAPVGGTDYQWRAGGDPVGTNSPVYRPTSADVDKTITVTVTAHRPGYADVVGTSAPTAPVLAGGNLTGWGMNDDGEATAPPLPQGLTYISISGGARFSVALRSDGTAIAWGDDYRDRTTVPPLPSGLTYTAVSAGTFHGLALRSDGTVVAWGDNSSGQTDVPALPPGLSYLAISAGINHSLALRSDGAVIAWGDNFFDETDVVPAPAGNPYVAIAAGGYHSLALRSDGTVVGWGQDDDGAVTDVPLLPNGVVYTAVTAGDMHSMALRSDGEIATWGFGGSGLTDVPPLPAGLTYTAVAANAIGDFSLALRSDGTAVGWGGNAFDQASVPVGLLSGRTVTAVAAGSLHGFALTADLAADGPPTISGVARFGETLTVTPPGYNAPPDQLEYRWAVNNIPNGATGATYELTASDIGKQITVRVRADKADYGTAVDFSAPAGPVAPKTLVVSASPSITGTARVGERLTASSGSFVPGPDHVSYQWYANGVPIDGADLATYDLTPAEAGKRITVRASAGKAGYATAHAFSDPVGPVVAAEWATNPTATITGTPEVGETLTADAGTPLPTPDTITFEWYADGQPIDGATGPNYVPTRSVLGAQITVLVTADREGYEPARSMSEPVGPVLTDRRPVVQLTTARSTVRLGQKIRLTWSSSDATTLVARGGWRGTKPVAGQERLRATRLGRTTYRLTATNANGSTTTKVVIRVKRRR